MNPSNHIPELINMMCRDIAEDPDAYADACYQLWQLGDDAVDSLEPFLYEPADEDIPYHKKETWCLKSAKILGNIGTKYALDTLRTAMFDINSLLRGLERHEPLIENPPIEGINYHLRWYQRASEWRFKDEFHDLNPSIKKWLYTIDFDLLFRQEIYDIAQFGDARFIRPLIKGLQEYDMKTNRYASDGLLEVGEPAVIPLIDCLNDVDKDFVRNVIWLLGALDDERAIEPLIKELDNKITYQYVIYALGRLKAKEALQPLMKFLEHEDEWTRCDTVTTIGYVGGKVYLDRLEPLLHDPSPLVQGRMATVFAGYGDERARRIIETLPQSSFKKGKETLLRKLNNPASEPSVSETEFTID